MSAHCWDFFFLLYIFKQRQQLLEFFNFFLERSSPADEFVTQRACGDEGHSEHDGAVCSFAGNRRQCVLLRCFQPSASGFSTTGLLLQQHTLVAHAQHRKTFFCVAVNAGNILNKKTIIRLSIIFERVCFFYKFKKKRRIPLLKHRLFLLQGSPGQIPGQDMEY